MAMRVKRRAVNGATHVRRLSEDGERWDEVSVMLMSRKLMEEPRSSRVNWRGG